MIDEFVLFDTLKSSRQMFECVFCLLGERLLCTYIHSSPQNGEEPCPTITIIKKNTKATSEKGKKL
jgi:hypothetical protein